MAIKKRTRDAQPQKPPLDVEIIEDTISFKPFYGERTDDALKQILSPKDRTALMGMVASSDGKTLSEEQRQAAIGQLVGAAEAGGPERAEALSELDHMCLSMVRGSEDTSSRRRSVLHPRDIGPELMDGVIDSIGGSFTDRDVPDMMGYGMIQLTPHLREDQQIRVADHWLSAIRGGNGENLGGQSDAVLGLMRDYERGQKPQPLFSTSDDRQTITKGTYDHLVKGIKDIIGAKIKGVPKGLLER